MLAMCVMDSSGRLARCGCVRNEITEGSEDTHQLDTRGPCSLFQSRVVQFPRVGSGMYPLGYRAPQCLVCWYGMSWPERGEVLRMFVMD